MSLLAKGVKAMKDALTKLIDVKTVITFSVVAAVIYLGVAGRIDPAKIFDLGMMIIAFYFGVKSVKDTLSK